MTDYLILRETTDNPTGWDPVAMIFAAESADDALSQGQTGKPCALAAVPWSPTIVDVAMVPELTPRESE